MIKIIALPLVLILAATAIYLATTASQRESFQQTLSDKTSIVLGAASHWITADETEEEYPYIGTNIPLKKQNEHERIVALLTNIQRENRGLRTLYWDPHLQDIARAHSQDMAERHYMAHTNPDSLGPSDRAENAGYNCRIAVPEEFITKGISENLFFGPAGYMEPEDAVYAWMGSYEHAQIMFDEHHRKIGIGIYEGEYFNDNGYFTTMLL